MGTVTRRPSRVRGRMTIIMPAQMVLTVRLTCSRSPAPMYWAIMMVAPMLRPMKREESRNTMGKPTLTAVSASLPTKLPTTMESTMLYICCRTFPSSSGSEKVASSPRGLPWVMSMEPCSLL